LPDAGPPPQDFGFGSVVARASRQRLLNRDGSFNVRRSGLGFFESWSAYHFLLRVSWPRFLLLLAGGFTAVNTLFATLYLACGPYALVGPAGDSLHSRFAQAYFFSVETLATIGYGHVSPRGMAANLVLTVESFVGLLALALIAGIVFARFARPVARVRFSDVAVVAPYRGGTGFMFRLANLRESELMELRARVLLARRRDGGTATDREFVQLALERDRVVFFPLTWTIVHPIDAASPLHGVTEEELRASDAEFLIYLTAYDETFSQTVHARSSYRSEEVVFGARFTNIVDLDADDRTVRVDVRQLSAIQRL
jgi:inward rectifier potassium channel